MRILSTISMAVLRRDYLINYITEIRNAGLINEINNVIYIKCQIVDISCQKIVWREFFFYIYDANVIHNIHIIGKYVKMITVCN